MSRRLIKKIELRFFQDDANGEYGLAHSDTLGNDSSFNAFWDGMGLFHDVFEHSHEYKDKHFRGEYAMNIGGEMAAMGAMWYFVDELGISSRLRQGSIYSPGQLMRQTTEMMVQDAIVYGNSQYGDRLESAVPRQTETENSELECQLEEFWQNVCKYHPQLAEGIESRRSSGEIEFGYEYKKSATREKIEDLHRYGFRMAQKLFQNNYENRHMLYSFIDMWNSFCKSNKAEDLARYLRGVEFSIYRNGDAIEWKATFIPMMGVSREELEYLEHPMEIKSWLHNTWQQAA